MDIMFRVLLLLSIGIPAVCAGEPTAEDYAVWAAVMADVDRGTVYLWHQVEPTSLFARGEEKSALHFFPEALPGAAAWNQPPAKLDIDYLNKLNAALHEASGRRFGAPHPIKALDQATVEKVVGRTPKSAWILSPRLIPDAEVIYRLSWPVYREDHRAAYVICGLFSQWKGSIVTCPIEKDPSGQWRLGRIIMWDLLCWGGGWPHKCDTREFIDD
jgi:hypothetical protein